MMSKQVLIGLMFLFSFVPSLHAIGDLTNQNPVVKTIHLGNSKNKLRFFPDTISFETGKLYKLIIKNPSPQKHYFNDVAFSRSVFTRKIQIKNKHNQSIAEIKGNISEIEVYPEGITEWWFVPVKSLKSSYLHCSIKGHSEAGMTGSISIR